MKLKKFMLAIGVIGLLLTGCDDPNTSSSQTSGSETSEITEAERFSAAGYSPLKGWPVESIRMHYTREGIDAAWVFTNVLTPTGFGQNTDLYVRSYEDELGIDVFKSFEVVRVTADATTFTNYVALYDGKTDYTVIVDEEHEFGIEAFSGKVRIGVSFVEENEAVPSATYFRFTVQEKEEFPGAPKVDRSAHRSEITFSNDFKVTTRSKDIVEWAFSDLYKFKVEVGESSTNVGNIPNNSGVGYLTPQLRIYKDQVLTLNMEQGTMKQVIFHGVNYTEDGVDVKSIDAFPVVEGAQQFKTANAVLYHFDADNTTSLSLVVTANARLLDVTVIYFL